MRRAGCLGFGVLVLSCAAPTSGPRGGDGRPDGGGIDAAAGPALAQIIVKRGRAWVTAATGTTWVQPLDHVDVLATLPETPGGPPVTACVIANVIVLERLPDGRVALLVLPEEAEQLALARRLGTLHVVRRHREEPGTLTEPVRVDAAALLLGARSRELREQRLRGFQRDPGQRPAGPPVGTRELALAVPDADRVAPGDRVDLVLTVDDASPPDPVALTLAELLIVTRTGPGGQLGLLVLPEEAARVLHAAQRGALGVALRNPADLSRQTEPREATRRRAVLGRPVHTLNDAPRWQGIPRIRIPRGVPGLGVYPPAPDARP